MRDARAGSLGGGTHGGAARVAGVGRRGPGGAPGEAPAPGMAPGARRSLCRMPELLRGCALCGLVQSVPLLAPGWVARCARCGHALADRVAAGRSMRRTFAAALAGLVLYPLAIALPVMTIERFGMVREASIWRGSLSLLAEGEVLVGGVVFLCSVVLPLVKLLALLVLSGWREGLRPPSRRRTHRAVELAGRWGMLDVLLVAVTVTWVKIGDLVEVRPGPGALAFTACVLFSLLASAWFDPHAVWERERA